MTIGIYCIENLVNGKKYIGKSRNIQKRFNIHKCYLRRQTYTKGCNRYLYRSVNKYGLDNFSFNIIEVHTNLDELRLSERELYWMDLYNTCDRQFGYNLIRLSSGRTKYPQESIDRIAAAHRGKKRSDEAKKNMSEAGKRREPSTDITRSKLAESVARFSFEQYSLDGVLIRTFDRIKDVISYGFRDNHVREVCDGYRTTHKGFIWKKIPKIVVDEKL